MAISQFTQVIMMFANFSSLTTLLVTNVYAHT